MHDFRVRASIGQLTPTSWRRGCGNNGMTSSIRLSLKSGQQIYINGAMLRADRKVTLELLNRAAFLLAQHIFSADEAKTPLQQVYFLVQTALIDPHSAPAMEPLIAERLAALTSDNAHHAITDGLA